MMACTPPPYRIIRAEVRAEGKSPAGRGGEVGRPCPAGPPRSGVGLASSLPPAVRMPVRTAIWNAAAQERSDGNAAFATLCSPTQFGRPPPVLDLSGHICHAWAVPASVQIDVAAGCLCHRNGDGLPMSSCRRCAFRRFRYPSTIMHGPFAFCPARMGRRG